FLRRFLHVLVIYSMHTFMLVKTHNKHKQEGQPNGCLCCGRYVSIARLQGSTYGK
ncbi:MAG: hypothetical protein ACI85N_001996, partial [Gammaproteobacteria bacterium]